MPLTCTKLRPVSAARSTNHAAVDPSVGGLRSRALPSHPTLAATAVAMSDASTCVDTLEMAAALLRAAQYTLHVVLTAHTGGCISSQRIRDGGVSTAT